MQAGASLPERRRRYAAEIMREGGVRNARVEEAFATVPREDYLTPPPWSIFAPGGLFVKDTSDPADLYRDVLVVLDRERGINNGQPSLHAAWIAAMDPQPGEIVVHIGAGTGYYTAVLAALVATGGQVHAYEIAADLAATAERNLDACASVTVHATSAVGAVLPAADVVYVNASASAPDPAWLKALNPGGRLILPWQQPGQRGGVAVQLTRTECGFRAAPTMQVAFIPCIGAMSRPTSGSRAEASEAQRTRSVWLREDRPPDETATAVYENVWFSSDTV